MSGMKQTASEFRMMLAMYCFLLSNSADKASKGQVRLHGVQLHEELSPGTLMLSWTMFP